MFKTFSGEANIYRHFSNANIYVKIVQFVRFNASVCFFFFKNLFHHYLCYTFIKQLFLCLNITALIRLNEFFCFGCNSSKKWHLNSFIPHKTCYQNNCMCKNRYCCTHQLSQYLNLLSKYLVSLSLSL